MNKELEDYKEHLRVIFENHKRKHASVENYARAQAIQDLQDNCGLYIEKEMIVNETPTCNHEFDFDAKYYGYCPQPKFCVKCGFYDYNGYKGIKF